MSHKNNLTTFTQKQNHNPFKPNQKSKSLTSVRQLLTQMDLSTKIRHHSHRKRQPQLDRQEIRKQMKSKWRDPGYCNLQFSNYKALKGKFLNQWQMQRIYLATRSYQTPKDFKGFKQTTQSRQFPKVSKQMYSQKFQKYLSTIQQKNQNQLFNPKKMYTEAASSAYGGTSCYRNTQQSLKKKQTFNGFTTQNKMFGMGTVTWKSGLSKKLKTLDC